MLDWSIRERNLRTFLRKRKVNRIDYGLDLITLIILLGIQWKAIDSVKYEKGITIFNQFTLREKTIIRNSIKIMIII